LRPVSEVMVERRERAKDEWVDGAGIGAVW
jgi:hypothetical protein